MSFTLSEVVPWGRAFEEYVSMFSLSPADLNRHILGCSDGPAEFNSRLSAQGGKIVSVDPIYEFTAGEIEKRINETYELVLAQTRKNKDQFVWDTISSVDELGQIRMSAMRSFLQDFEKGKAVGRYRMGSLPRLSFDDKEFDLALCSHFLFLYSEQFSQEFHLSSMKELCRVAREVRIFPILELDSTPSRHFKSLITALNRNHYAPEVKKVSYEFQKGGNEMLIVRSVGNSH